MVGQPHGQTGVPANDRVGYIVPTITLPPWWRIVDQYTAVVLLQMEKTHTWAMEQ